ncbi:MAG: hydroxyacid dehydrogenase [Candidatus Peregrinibacteria bacterium]|nr:hydroxyacid dehydrogenase [Candidatus Peregrinibacteria bacterium]MCB9808186.1 hydroxyacid dehydrogenase [Candidatus Peribacteria bacterium]
MNIVFLQVDIEDRKRVADRFPNADIIDGVPSDLVAACKDADVVSCFIGIEWTADVLKQLPKLQLLCTRSVGYNHIDLDYCSAHGITVCNVPDYGSHVIAEHVFALLLAKLRHIAEGDAKVESGEFDYHGLRGVSLRGKTLGIVGTGKIGRKAAQIAAGFGMKIVAVDRCRTVELEDLLHVKYTDMDDLLACSDIITLHLPALPETIHMINAEAFSKMKDGVVLVNTARGELIDSKALLNALNSGKVKYALLDVLEHEHNFEENKELIKHPSVVTTPHTAFYAEESMTNMYEDAFESIAQFLKEEVPGHMVKPPTVVCDLPGVKKS